MKKSKYASSDAMTGSYMASARRGPLLTMEEEHALCERRDSGDESAVNELVERNLLLVIRVARGFLRGAEGEMDDLIGVGNVGLVEAARKFDPARSGKFSTVAVLYIKKAIFAYFADSRRTVRLPRHIGQILSRLRRGVPLSEEQARTMERYGDDIMRDTLLESSACEPSDRDPSTAFMDTLPDRRDRTPEYEPDHLAWVAETLARIPERQQRFVRMFFGVGSERRTYEAIGAQEGITKERARQIVADGVNSMSGKATDSMMPMFRRALYPANVTVTKARQLYKSIV